MKILWFANTPCGASEILSPNQNIAGWLKSLEEQLLLQVGVDLVVCFYWKENISPFKHNKTLYYPIYRNYKYYHLANKILKYTNEEKEIAELLKVIEVVEPDVIHIHGTEDNFGLVQEYTKIPIVVSLQGILSPYSEKFFSGIPASTILFYEGLKNKLKLNSQIISYKILIKFAFREKEILYKTKNIIGRTEWDNRVSSLLAPNSQYFLGNEMLRQLFYENQWNKSQFCSPLRIVTIMSGGIYKGIEVIVKTAKLLCKLSQFKFVWTVIGQTESDLFPKVVKKWLNINYNTINIDLVGNKDEKEIVNLLLDADIYCQVSHIENSPNSVCEAMLLGLPIIASFAGGTDSILKNGEEGILIQDGDSYSLAGAIYKLRANFQQAADFGKAANKKAMRRHNKEQIVKDTLEVYKSISNKMI